MKKNILSLLLLISLCSFGHAQKKPAADSLLKLINASQSEDTTKVLLLLEYSRCFYPINPDSVERINLRAVALAEKIHFSYGIIRGYNGIAMAKWRKNDIPGAKRIFFKALALADEYKHIPMQIMVGDNLGVFYHSFGQLDSAEIFYLRAMDAGKENKTVKYYAKTLSDLSGNYIARADYIKAIQYLMEAKKLNVVTGDKTNQVANCIGLGNIYEGLRDFDRAVVAYREAVMLNDSLKNLDFKISIFQNMGLLYTDIKVNVDSARYYLNMAREMALKNDRQESYLASLINLGNIEVKQKKYREALSYYLTAYESPLLTRKNYEHTAILVNLGFVYFQLGESGKAEKFAVEGLALAHAGGYLAFEQTALGDLAQIEARKNNFKAAYLYQLKTDTLKDSIWSETVKSRITEATFKMALEQSETEKALLLKDNEIKMQTIKNQWFIVGGIVLVLLLVIALMTVVIRTNRKQKALNGILDHKNRQLEELNITKDKFISIIAHDLKSPFNALLGFLTELDENYMDYDEKTKHDIIHKLKKSSYNTFNLLINLLDWSQSQQGKLKSVAEDFRLSRITDEVFTVLSTRAVMKKQTLTSDFDENLTIHSDPQIIKSILINLVNNAIKYTPMGGKIRVTAQAGENELQLSVEDSGIGIPKNEIENLFRLDSNFNRKGTEQEPGTGLGLVMVNEYVTLLGGEIQVTSEEGKGSRFVVKIKGPARDNLRQDL